MKKLLILLLLFSIIASLFAVTALADAQLAGDVSGDGKVTPYDALQVQAYLHGEMSLTEQQIAAAIAACPSIPTLSTAHIVSIFFKPLIGQSKLAPEQDGLFHIRSAEDMALLRSFPYGGFSLDTDVDMRDTAWTPPVFQGVLFGNGHTVSNLSVTAANSNVNAGALFVKLGSAANPTAAIRNLTLENTSLTTSATHQNAGLLCGTNYGVIADASIMNGSIACSVQKTDASVGAEAGVSYGAVSSAGTVECTIQNYGTAADVVGKTEAGGSTSHSGSCKLIADGTTVIDKEQFADTSVSRDAVVQLMVDMSEIKWKDPLETVTYRDTTTLSTYTVTKNKTYYGMKYGHEGASLDAMLDKLTLSGSTYLVNEHFESYETEPENVLHIPTGAIIMGHYFSNDCATSVGWALAVVSGTFTGERVSHMLPISKNCTKYGSVKVGNYDLSRTEALGTHYTVWVTGPSVDDQQIRSILTDDEGNLDTVNLNALYESYALLQPGDAIGECDRYYNTSTGKISTDGHTKLVKSISVVRNADGSIDPVKSTIATIECGGGGTKLHTSSSTSWCYNNYNFKKYAGFASDSDETLNANKRYYVYVPYTTQELASGVRPATYIQLKNSSSPFSGIVSSNYRIVWTSVTVDGVTNKSFTGTQPWGNTFDNEYEGLDESGFTSNATIRAISTAVTEASRLVYKSVNLQKHAAAFADLTPGTHSYEITVKVGTGEMKTFSGTFTT